MKELLGHASNLLLAPNLDTLSKVRAQVELILICSEPTWSYGVEGLTRNREVSSTRLLCGHKALRDTAKQLLVLADAAEALEKSMNEAVAATESEAS